MATPYTIAVAGKGGVGKTTTCGMIIDYLCSKKNGPVLVVDADANANLNEVLGVEVETDDPLTYVKNYLKGKAVSVTAEPGAEGVVTVFADCDGLIQKFIFTPV